MSEQHAEKAIKEDPYSCVTLETQYYFQNRTTGQASQHPLTVRQLCRILQSTNQVLTPDTQVLRVTADGSYVTAAWETLREVPVVRQVIPEWHYESQTATVQGPVSCVQLAERFRRGDDLTLATRVYSPLTSEWEAIADLPELQIAMDAFDRIDTAATSNMPAAKASTHQPSKQQQDDLDEFLSATDDLGSDKMANDGKNSASPSLVNDEEESYESDQGTRYVKDAATGNWVHEALMMAPQQQQEKPQPARTTATTAATTKKRRRAKFASKYARCWIYVTGLPSDTTEEALAKHFSKAGILALDPETQRPKMKLYRHKEPSPLQGRVKGDASLCYARPESVDLALTLLDGAPFVGGDNNNTKSRNIHVERAKFEQHGLQFDASRSRISNAQRKVARLAAIQATDWDEGDFNGRLTGGRKGLRIIVLKGLFDPSSSSQIDEDWEDLETNVRSECEQWGVVEKITVFSKHPEGVVIVKFVQPSAASEAVKAWDGRERWRMSAGRVRAHYWDGVTDYTLRDEEQDQKEEQQRHKEFGDWLEKQELPENLRLQTE